MSAQFDFDRVINRYGTDCCKFDSAAANGLPEDVLPMWVADMDFRAPETVLDALRRGVDHGIFGYPDVQEDYFEAVESWFDRRFQWRVRPEWLVRAPGVVFALACAVRALTEAGDAVLIQPPVYRPFFNVVETNDRRVVESPLKQVNGRYEIDFDDFESAVTSNGVKLFILCSPHNPVCRVWTAEELRRLGEICARHDVIVVSDEIHCDFTFEGHPHTPFVKAAPEMAERAIVCTAPSKTFNLAGLQASNLFIPGEAVRAQFKKEMDRTGYHELNCLGLAACKAAYRTGEAWLEALKPYLKGNADYMSRFLKENLPMLKMVEPEGTYLSWVDFSALGMTPGALHEFIVHRARLWLDDGGIFGKCGEQFQRFVLACPRATLEEGMRRLKAAVDEL